MEYVIRTTSGELYHHGILGQKWGVRRYQNKDGSLTPAGKKHKSDSNKKEISEVAKKRIIKGAIAITTVAAAGMYIKSHPEQISKISSTIKNTSLKDVSSKAVENGKAYVKDYLKSAKNGVKEGVKEAMKEAPKKAAKTVVTGIVLNETKKALDKVAGKEESDKIFQANDPKKIGKFWKVQKDDND